VRAALGLGIFIFVDICMGIASGCHLVYKLERVQTWSGSDASSPRKAQCCRKALYTFSTSEMSLTFYHFVIPWSNPVFILA